ncbi:MULTISPECIES: vitamin K epoxide reductase family protein [Streptomyces]|uniref:vitamin K epoxide reductase family protein n=1 Tax=Streptomyces lycopersici TaxID=2974589 RepID=UPI0021D3AED0|nr:vitamin K epoxide reductase family protein [Streptomyces sp. NEAU-383]
MSRARPGRQGRRTGWLLTLAGAVGWLASFQLTVDDWRLLKDPAYQPPCDISPIVSCGSVMSSPEGSVFGFPNMLLGLGAFAAVTVLGLAVLTGARLHRMQRCTTSGGESSPCRRPHGERVQAPRTGLVHGACFLPPGGRAAQPSPWASHRSGPKTS